MLASNIHPRVVQRRPGHSSIAIRMDIYSHLMPNMQGDAAAAVDDVLRAAIKDAPKMLGSKAVANGLFGPSSFLR